MTVAVLKVGNLEFVCVCVCVFVFVFSLNMICVDPNSIYIISLQEKCCQGTGDCMTMMSR